MTTPILAKDWEIKFFRPVATPLPAPVGKFDASNPTVAVTSGSQVPQALNAFPDQSTLASDLPGAGDASYSGVTYQMPWYYSSGPNGRPYWDFSQPTSDPSLMGAGSAVYNSTQKALVNVSAYSIAVVFQVPTAAELGGNHALCGRTYSDGVSMEVFSDLTIAHGTSNAAKASGHGLTVPTGQWVIGIVTVLDATHVNVRLNGQQGACTTFASFDPTVDNSGVVAIGVGSAFNFSGDKSSCQIAALQIYNSPLSTAQAQALEAQLAVEYNIGLASGSTSTGPTFTWQMMSVPSTQIARIQFEALEKGGYANGSVHMLTPWEKYGFAGDERADIYVNSVLQYRGYVHLPAATISSPESKTLGIFGPIAKANRIVVESRYGFNAYTDLSQFVTKMFNDYVAVNPAFAGCLTDIQNVGVHIQSFDAYQQTFPQAVQQLIDRAPNCAYWGWDAVLQTDGTYKDRFYFRPRAVAANPVQLSVGQHVLDTTIPSDLTRLVNQAHFVGDKADQPNIVTNGYFNFEVPADETHGNLLGDYSFEFSHENQTTAWKFNSNASAKSVQGPGDGLPGARTGSDWVALDQAGENIEQTIWPDITRPFLFSTWVRVGDPVGNPNCQFDFYVKEIASDGTTVLATHYFYQNQTVPALSAYDGNPSNYQYIAGTYTVVNTGTCKALLFGVLAHSGTNHGDGINVDDCNVNYSDRAVQNGWRESIAPVYQDVGPGPSTPALATGTEWAHRPTDDANNVQPLRGPTCIKINPGNAGADSKTFAELRTEAWARPGLNAWRYYSIVFFVSCAPGSLFSVTLGADEYDQNNNLFAEYESPLLQPSAADGAWYPVVYTFQSPNTQVTCDAFLRVRSTVPVYVGGCMWVEGVIPAECVDDLNFWEGDAYERIIRCDDPLLATIDASHQITAAAAASINTYGIAYGLQRVSGVLDKKTAYIAAIGLFNELAVPVIQSTITAVNYKQPMDFTRMLQITNLPSAPNPLWIARYEYRIDADIKLQLDLNNEYPSLTLLLLADEQRAAVKRQTSSTDASGNGSSPQNSGAPSGTGAASDANTVHLSTALGALETMTTPKAIAPGSDVVALELKRFSAGAVSDLLETLSETGTVLGGIKASGQPYVGTHELAQTGVGDLAGAGSAGNSPQLSVSGVTAGAYTNADITVDAKGRVTVASNGSAAGMGNPMTTLGDLITGAAGGSPQRLAVGSNTQVLTVVSGAPAWAAAGGGSSVAGSFSETTYFSFGSDGKVLKNVITLSSGNITNWVQTVATVADIAGASLLQWLDPTVIGVANGAAVSTWAHTSAGGDATQATAGNQPTFASTGIAGKPAVRFTRASTQFMTFPSISPTTIEIFAVVMANTSNNAAAVLCKPAGTTWVAPYAYWDLRCGSGASGAAYDFWVNAYVGTNSGNEVFTSSWAGLDVPVLLHARYDGASIGLDWNNLNWLGHPDAGGNIPSGTNAVYLGAEGGTTTAIETFDGWIGDVIICTPLNPGQANLMKALLSNKYGGCFGPF